MGRLPTDESSALPSKFLCMGKEINHRDTENTEFLIFSVSSVPLWFYLCLIPLCPG